MRGPILPLQLVICASEKHAMARTLPLRLCSIERCEHAVLRKCRTVVGILVGSDFRALQSVHLCVAVLLMVIDLQEFS